MNRIGITAFALMGAIMLASPGASAEELVYNNPKDGSVQQVEEWFEHNFKDLTSRETIEWGKVDKKENGTFAVYYKYRATLKNGQSVITHQIFSFDKTGKFVKQLWVNAPVEKPSAKEESGN